MPYYMIFNSASGALQSYGYSSDALPLPAGAIECTAAQYAAAPWVELQAGAIVAITPPAPPAPTPAQQATAAINAGLAITSTSTPALNATYPINATAQAQIIVPAEFFSRSAAKAVRPARASIRAPMAVYAPISSMLR